MTRELPLAYMAQRLRLARIYEGPTEVHRMVIARRSLRIRPGSRQRLKARRQAPRF